MDICINEPPLPTDVFDDVNTPMSCINTADIDDIERSSSYTCSLKNIAKRSTIPCEHILPSVFWGDENLNDTNVQRGTQAYCQLVPPFMLNKHTNHLGISNQKYH